MGGNHVGESHRLVGPANPKQNFEILVLALQHVAVFEGGDEIVVDDQRAVGDVDDADVEVRAQVRVDVFDLQRRLAEREFPLRAAEARRGVVADELLGGQLRVLLVVAGINETAELGRLCDDTLIAVTVIAVVG